MSAPLRDLAKWFRSMAVDERNLQAQARTIGSREYHHGCADTLEACADKLDEAIKAARG